MEPLSGIDRAYIGLESDDVPADFLSIVTLDPSTAPDRHDWERFHAEAAVRVPQVEALTRRLVSAPLSSAPEQWVVDPEFDIDRHLHRIACPAPGDLAALQRLALDVASGVLDRDRPLWEMWYVEGMADGGAALLFKIHHAAIDGMGAVKAFATIFDTEPRPFDPHEAPTPVVGDRVPSGVELLVRSLPDQALAPLRATRGVVTLVGSELRAIGESLLGGGGSDGGGDGSSSGDWAGLPPTTVLNRAPSSYERSLGLATVGLDAVKDIAHASGATVNDVVVTLVTGALRDYLGGRGELPDEPMRAVCPVNVRTDDDEGGGNAFTAMAVPLPTHLDDPAERLRYVAEATKARKPSSGGSGSGGSGGGASSARTFLEIVDTVPSTAFSVMGTLATSGALTMTPPMANLVVSNVMGSPETLYLAGAKITHMHGRTMAGPGLGMMIHCTSYAGQLDFGATALAELVPDPQRIVDGLAGHLEALRVAVR